MPQSIDGHMNNLSASTHRLIPLSRRILTSHFRMVWLYYLAALILVYYILRRFVLESFYISMRNRYVLITGCDSGFGRLLALRLLSQGVHVFAGCYTDIVSLFLNAILNLERYHISSLTTLTIEAQFATDNCFQGYRFSCVIDSPGSLFTNKDALFTIRTNS